MKRIVLTLVALATMGIGSAAWAGNGFCGPGNSRGPGYGPQTFGYGSAYRGGYNYGRPGYGYTSNYGYPGGYGYTSNYGYGGGAGCGNSYAPSTFGYGANYGSPYNTYSNPGVGTGFSFSFFR